MTTETQRHKERRFFLAADNTRSARRKFENRLVKPDLESAGTLNVLAAPAFQFLRALSVLCGKRTFAISVLCGDSFLELQVQPQAWHGHWAADLVISGVVHVLQVESEEDTAPNMRGVEHLLDGFAAISQSPVAEKKSQTTISQVRLMRLRDTARDERCTSAVETAMPTRSLAYTPNSTPSLSSV